MNTGLPRYQTASAISCSVAERTLKGCFALVTGRSCLEFQWVQPTIRSYSFVGEIFEMNVCSNQGSRRSQETMAMPTNSSVLTPLAGC